MKRTLTYVLVVFAVVLQAQNLVLNPSFEEYSTCPESPGQADYALGWQKFRLTPDYFNVCNANDYCDVPSNAFGYQLPHTGDSYAGLLTYDQATPNTREYLGIALLEPLTIGIPVNVSFWISPGGWGWYQVQRFKYSADGIGLFFTTTPWSGTSGPIPNSSAVHLETPQTDTLNWVFVSGTYIPDSSYQYVVIGNCFSDSLTHLVVQDGVAPFNGAYSFIDDICVSTNDECIWAGQEGVTRIGAEELTLLQPNPFSTTIEVKSYDSDRLMSIQVHDALGNLECTRKVDSNSLVRIEGTDPWPLGIHILTLGFLSGKHRTLLGVHIAD